MKELSKFNKETSINLIQSICNDENEISLVCSLSKFLMLFNLFEKNFLKDLGNWYEVPQNYEIDETEITNEFNFFKDRYYKDGKETSIFKGLNIYKKWEIKKNFKEDNNKFETLLRISYMFRNNLYHGYKHILDLKKYEECFEKINGFMIKIISDANTKGENSVNTEKGICFKG